MRKIVFICLIVVAVCANEKNDKEGIYDYFHKNGDIPRADGTTFRESLRPSFDCGKANGVAEGAICSSAYYTLIVSDDIKYIYPTFIYLDNLFSSYYRFAMKHLPKAKKQEIKKIAKEAMEHRDSASSCYEGEDGKEIVSNTAATTACLSDIIILSYERGIQELTTYLSKHDEKFLKNPLSKYVKDIENLDYLNSEEFLDKLYIDKIIDESGKLIIKDSKGGFQD